MLAGVGDTVLHLVSGPQSSLKLVANHNLHSPAFLASSLPPASIEVSEKGGVLKLGPLCGGGVEEEQEEMEAQEGQARLSGCSVTCL